MSMSTVVASDTVSGSTTHPTSQPPPLSMPASIHDLGLVLSPVTDDGSEEVHIDQSADANMQQISSLIDQLGNQGAPVFSASANDWASIPPPTPRAETHSPLNIQMELGLPAPIDNDIQQTIEDAMTRTITSVKGIIIEATKAQTADIKRYITSSMASAVTDLKESQRDHNMRICSNLKTVGGFKVKDQVRSHQV